MPNYDVEIDLSDVVAPAHLLRTRAVLEKMRPGQTLSIITTAPSSMKDFTLWAKQSGNPLIVSQPVGSKYHFVMRKP